MYRNQKGSTLILSLLALTVCVILGTVFISANYNDNKQSINEENRLKAYYIARSAAHSTAEWLLDTNNLPNVTQVVPADTGGETQGSGTLDGLPFTTSVGRDSDDRHLIIVKGMATVGGIYAEATITLDESRIYDGSIPFDNVIFSHSNVTLTGNTEVQGGIEAGGVVNYNNNVIITGDVVEDSDLIYPPWVLNNVPPNADPYNLQVNNNETIVISTDKRYGTIHVKNGGLLQVQLSGGDLILMVDVLDMDGTFEVLGTGTLKLYVNDGRVSQPDIDIGGEFINSTENLYIYLAPESEMKLPGGSVFRGFVYGPEATVDLNGTPGFFGAMIVGEVTGVGTSDIYYSESAAGDVYPDGIGVVRFSGGMWEN